MNAIIEDEELWAHYFGAALIGRSGAQTHEHIHELSAIADEALKAHHERWSKKEEAPCPTKKSPVIKRTPKK